MERYSIKNGDIYTFTVTLWCGKFIMNCEWGFGRRKSWSVSNFYTGILVEGLRITTETPAKCKCKAERCRYTI